MKVAPGIVNSTCSHDTGSVSNVTCSSGGLWKLSVMIGEPQEHNRGNLSQDQAHCNNPYCWEIQGQLQGGWWWFLHMHLSPPQPFSGDPLPPSCLAAPLAGPCWLSGTWIWPPTKTVPPELCSLQSNWNPSRATDLGITPRPRGCSSLPASAGMINSCCSLWDFFQLISWQGVA